MKKTEKKYISSEAYRQMLVKDGNRRFQEWHEAFITYQKKFLEAQEKKRLSLKSNS
jgi:hypothetical protein